MKKILLVDDERWVRTALKWTINKLNLPLQVIHECQNGLEALDWIKMNEVDLILTDIRMPVMDGLSLVKELSTLNESYEVIVISVHDEFQFVQQAIRSGVTDYLLKPIEENEIKACLEKWLNKKSNEDNTSKQMLAEKDTLPLSTIDRILDYIEKTPLDQITLKEAAESIHINPSYLSQLFKQQLNKKFVDYITELRIEESKRLLQNTTLRMSEIAERVGYSDLAYFSNNFKKIVGSSPSEYRNLNSKTSDGHLTKR
ncbi:YesN/AraC family two-component response regulator [Neobacillus niacini]|jgi:YesN/AraC family two-component response regulator|uniref:response regulator transcription factor n=1 Tax=Neobacillus niacini TaxID=86668 RepID=UPI00278488DB|nr:response regulator [Neobacillus niacini]MDQ1004726.1 YesN/AraC family two-component response regulator [Neobacillus niacini]